MSLDIISIQPEKRLYETPLLFVHGAWHGNWCWAENFLPYFAQQGFEVYAVSLRGHDKSPSDKALKWVRAADYVADVVEAVKQLPKHPILIGHSMGGYVVQKYLETYFAPAAVLVASVPTTGVLRTSLAIAKNHPIQFIKLNLKMSLYEIVNTPAMVRELLFSPSTPDEMIERTLSKIQDESYLGFLDMLAFDLPKPKRGQSPILVLGGEEDGIFTQNEVEKTAVSYNTTPHFFPMGHNMMLETGWEAVADHIISWIHAL